MKMDILSKTLPVFRQPRALITGLRGFTGDYLARELEAQGYEIYGTAFGDEESGERVFHVDMCDRAALQNVVEQVEPDVVAHLAAISFVAHGNVEDIYRINIMGTRNLLEALSSLRRKPHCVLVASSANVYGNSQEGVIAETQAPLPANDYAISKLAMEHVARLWMDKLPIVITRPFNYSGVGQADKFLIPKIIHHFKNKIKVIELGNIDVARDFNDVRFVAKAYAQLLQTAPKGEIYNICSGTSYTLREVIALAEKLSGYKITVKVNPAFVRANEVRILQGDGSKLAAILGDVTTYTLEETLAWMLFETLEEVEAVA